MQRRLSSSAVFRYNGVSYDYPAELAQTCDNFLTFLDTDMTKIAMHVEPQLKSMFMPIGVKKARKMAEYLSTVKIVLNQFGLTDRRLWQ